MTSEDKQRIDKLEQELISLHDKYNESQAAKAAAEKSAAESKAKSSWFSKEMVAVYIAVIGGITAWVENYFSREAIEARHNSKEVAIEKSKDKDQQVEVKVNEGIVRYVDYRINEVSGVCTIYLDAVMNAMPAYQRRQVTRFIEQASSESDNTDPSFAPENTSPFEVIHQAAENDEDINPKDVVEKSGRKLPVKK